MIEQTFAAYEAVLPVWPEFIAINALMLMVMTAFVPPSKDIVAGLIAICLLGPIGFVFFALVALAAAISLLWRTCRGK